MDDGALRFAGHRLGGQRRNRPQCLGRRQEGAVEGRMQAERGIDETRQDLRLVETASGESNVVDEQAAVRDRDAGLSERCSLSIDQADMPIPGADGQRLGGGSQMLPSVVAGSSGG